MQFFVESTNIDEEDQPCEGAVPYEEWYEERFAGSDEEWLKATIRNPHGKLWTDEGKDHGTYVFPKYQPVGKNQMVGTYGMTAVTAVKWEREEHIGLTRQMVRKKWTVEVKSLEQLTDLIANNDDEEAHIEQYGGEWFLKLGCDDAFDD